MAEKEEVINLNVGGKKFTCYKSTLLSYPDTLLARMFTTSADIAKKGEDGCYFFDRNPEIFSQILEFYRTKRLVIPKEMLLENVKEELAYFGITIDEDDIEVQGEREDTDLVKSFLTFNEVLAQISAKGIHLGNVVSYTEVQDDVDKQPELDTEESLENQKERTISEWVEGKNISSVHKVRTAPTPEFKQKFGEEKHSHSDSEEEEERNQKERELYMNPRVKKAPHKKPKIEKDSETLKQEEDYTNLGKLGSNLAKLRESEVFCCGGWFLVPEKDRPHLYIESDTLAPKKTTQVVWSCLEDDKWVPFPTYMSNTIEFAKQNGIPQVDVHNFIDVDEMKEQYRGEIGYEFRSIKREEIEVEPQDQKVWMDCGDCASLSLDTITPLCTPAPFGDLATMKTVFDPNVRIALECNASKFKFMDCRHMINTIMLYLKKTMWEDRYLDIEPYKLNVYEKGGFFKPHVDTPVNARTMVGTLVICLPVAHTGGELIVRHGESEHTFDFSDPANIDKIQWAAFFSDCEHEVKPVTSGHRVTLSYSIFIASDFIEDEEQPDDMRVLLANMHVGNAIPKWPEDYYSNQFTYFYRSPGTPKPNTASLQDIYDGLKRVSTASVGLFLAHKYTIRGLSVENLKGSDKALYEFLSSKPNLKVTMMPVILRIKYMQAYKYDSVDPKIISRVVYALSKKDVKYLRGIGEKPTHPWQKVPFVVATTRGQLVSRDHSDAQTGAMGNWAPEEDDALYLNAALIVDKI